MDFYSGVSLRSREASSRRSTRETSLAPFYNKFAEDTGSPQKKTFSFSDGNKASFSKTSSSSSPNTGRNSLNRIGTDGIIPDVVLADRMICVIRYAELSDDPCFISSSISTRKVAEDGELLFESNKNKELCFNPNCYLQLILEYICEELSLDITSDFDFCTEDGQRTRFRDFKVNSNGLTVFTRGQIYYVIILRLNSQGEVIRATPLLNKHTQEYARLTNALKKIMQYRGSSSATAKQKDSDQRLGKGQNSNYSYSIKSPAKSLVSLRAMSGNVRRSAASKSGSKKKLAK